MNAEGAGRPNEPLEVAALKTHGDGITPGHRRLPIPSGTEIAQQNTEPGWQPPTPPLCRDGTPLCKPAQQLHQDIWWAGRNHLHVEFDYVWINAWVRNEDQIVRNWKIIATQGEMGYYGSNGVRGGMIPHPKIKENMTLEALNSRYWQRGGFDPVSRAKLGIAKLKMAGGLMEFEEKVAAKHAKDQTMGSKSSSSDDTLKWD